MADMTLPEAIELDTLEQFDALLAPARLQLAQLLATPMTAKEAAAEMDVPVTRLYYHLNTLLEHGVIRVVEERPRGSLTERVFQAAGRSIRPSKEFLERYGSEGIAEVGSLTFRHAEARFVEAAREGLIGMERDDGPRTTSFGLAKITMTPDRLDELVRRVDSIIEDYRDDEGEIEVSLFTALHIRKDDR